MFGDKFGVCSAIRSGYVRREGRGMFAATPEARAAGEMRRAEEMEARKRHAETTGEESAREAEEAHEARAAHEAEGRVLVVRARLRRVAERRHLVERQRGERRGRR